MTKNKLTHQNNRINRYIGRFNFENPDWKNMPMDFLETDTKKLNPSEKGIYHGIKLAWYIEKGRRRLYTNTIKIGFTIALIIISGLYFRLVFSSPAFTAVKEVSAATMSAGIKKLTIQKDDPFSEILDSTISAKRSSNSDNK